MTTTDAATFCATLVDEWARSGITDAFVAPGSRSTPVALALAADHRITVHLFHDERAASFAALGHGLATGTPGVVLCSSGTAGTHFHAAVAEADLSGVPMVVCTADRPPELWHVGAPQVIDQTHLFGSAVRYFAEPGVPDGAVATTWRSFASRLVAEASGWRNRPGPVHANLSFRDPLVGEPGPLPPGRDGGAPWHRTAPFAPTAGLSSREASELAGRLVADGDQPGAPTARAGVIVAGRGTDDPAVVLDLARRLGWPVLADHRSGCRAGPPAVRHVDGLLRSAAFADRVRPEVMVRIGEPLASKKLAQWMGRSDADVITFVDGGRWLDPERTTATLVAVPGALAAVAAALPDRVVPSSTGAVWAEADAAAVEAVDRALEGHDGGPAASTDPAGGRDGGRMDEISLARRVVRAVPAGGALMVSSSMPVRDVEWFGPDRADITVHGNRGANGIDGVVSTAIGIALTGVPTTVLIGDVAFLHDSTALIGLADRPVDLHIVVADNDGGGIFSFLPQATQLEPATFEVLFGTPHGTDLAALATAHRIPVVPPPAVSTDNHRELGRPRISVVAVADRSSNVTVHDMVNTAIARATTAPTMRSTGSVSRSANAT